MTFYTVNTVGIKKRTEGLCSCSLFIGILDLVEQKSSELWLQIYCWLEELEKVLKRFSSPSKQLITLYYFNECRTLKESWKNSYWFGSLCTCTLPFLHYNCCSMPTLTLLIWHLRISCMPMAFCILIIKSLKHQTWKYQPCQLTNALMQVKQTISTPKISALNIT